jgi:hypothetical protein
MLEGREVSVTGPVRTENVELPTGGMAFQAAKSLADETAARILEDPVCLSWYDRGEDRESPAHVGECHDGCEMRGFEEYALTRGATLKVVVGGGAYTFCYRPLGEFAEPE